MPGALSLQAPRLAGGLVVHERAHVRQHELLGPLFLPAYLLLHAFCGYDENPFEKQAREAELSASRSPRSG